MLYFGCWSDAGHFLHDPSGRRVYEHGPDALERCPLSARNIDGVFPPQLAGQPDNRTQLTHIHGWTVLAMWDRSVDGRPGSNAAFLERGTLLEHQMWRAAEVQFPSIVHRLAAFDAHLLRPSRIFAPTQDVLRERAAWYLGGCDGLEDRAGYYASGDCARDAGGDLAAALAIIDKLEASAREDAARKALRQMEGA